jgi:uncharacterized phage protein gp47/JayE
MSALEITVNGVSVESWETIYARVVTRFKEIYGPDIDLSLNTPDGQVIGIFSKAYLDLQAYGLNLSFMFDPDLALGVHLDRIVKLCGIWRRGTTRSSANLTVITDRDLSIPAGWIVRDDNNMQWVTTTPDYLPAGTNTVTVWAQNWGKVDAPANIIKTPMTIVLGVVSVTNPEAAAPGINEETDEHLRLRRNKSLEKPAYSTIGSLYAALANLPGVTDIAPYENFTGAYDADKDLADHTYWFVIEGGADADIIKTMVSDKTGGTGLKGAQVGSWPETLTRPDGTSFTLIHSGYKYDRPIEVNISIRLTVRRKQSTSAVDTAAIRQAIAAQTFYINEDLSVTTLYCAIYTAGSNFVANDLEISRDGSTWESEEIAAGYQEKFIILPANISITEIV